MILLYRLLLLITLPFFLIIGSLFSAKIRRGLSLRTEKLKDLPRLHSCFWFHASSGEFEYARPVIKRLKKDHPGIPILVTYFSPSYAKTIESDSLVDHAYPLPLDLPGSLLSFIHKVNPKAVFFSRTDLWPELLTQLKAKKIPSVLFSFYQKPNQNFIGRSVKLWLLKKLMVIDCVDKETQNFLASHKINSQCSGDTRYDQVFDRLDMAKPLPFELGNDGGKVVVLGSTWSEDERVMLPSLKANEKLWSKIILVPHEVDEGHVSSIEKKLKSLNLSSERFSQIQGKSSAQVIVVDQFGWLMSLYGFGDLAFVGGSFKGSVHSVMEPLAHGLQVVLGPFIQNNAESLEFKDLGFVHLASNETQMSELLQKLLTEKKQSQLKSLMESKRGASERLVQSLNILEKSLREF